MENVWKDVKGYENLYQVGSQGVIKSLERIVTNHRGEYKIPQRLIKIHSNPCGHLRVGLFKNGKRTFYGLHRLVAEAFIENPYNLPEINHINGVKTCNSIDNLEWVTRSQNMIHFNRIIKNRLES